MAYDSSAIPWTDDQWARIENVIQQEAQSARVAASFLPLFGPLPPDADFVRDETIVDGALTTPATISDRATKQLATLQVKVELRGPQIADPQLSSALQLFRRAANVLARLEDLVVFRGLVNPHRLRATLGSTLQGDWEITSGEPTEGLWFIAPGVGRVPGLTAAARAPLGDSLVGGVSDAIGILEGNGHFGPFAVVLGPRFFTAVQTPNGGSLVLPQDRIIPFLGGGSLVRSSTLPQNAGVVVALGGAPVDLVVARDMSVNFLTVTTDPTFLFRVFEKIVLRIKQPAAICRLEP
jgi:uncharacterized linocin/CFP29 family protein